ATSSPAFSPGGVAGELEGDLVEPLPCGRPAVARAVGLAGELDPQRGVEVRVVVDEVGSLAEGPARRVAPRTVRTVAVAGRVDHVPRSPGERRDALSVGDRVGRGLVVRDVEREADGGSSVDRPWGGKRRTRPGATSSADHPGDCPGTPK